jgi:hypothetical protein
MPSQYNAAVQTEDLKFLLALEPTWIVSLNGEQYQTLSSSDISVDDCRIHLGPQVRRLLEVQWLRPNVIRLHARVKYRSRVDVITLFPGNRLPSSAQSQRRRRQFQTSIAPAVCDYLGTRKIERQMLYSDRRYGIGGAYPRFTTGSHAVITVDPDESSSVVNAIMRAALLWEPLVRRHMTVVIPHGRHHTISARLRVTPHLRNRFNWVQWDGHALSPLATDSIAPETHVHGFDMPEVSEEVARICALAPDLLQAVPYIPGRAVSVRLRGVEIARVSAEGTTYPLGEPLEQIIHEIAEARRPGSRHPLARAHEERWLESNVISQIRQVLPSIDVRHIYPQVPSFVGEERNIIDLLTATREGRLVIIEIKASADPDLPFQALDYWIAVERHRKAGEFQTQGYFAGRTIQDLPALLVLVAPLLGYHKTVGRLLNTLPKDVPLLEVGVNQGWKREIKVLRRRGLVG